MKQDNQIKTICVISVPYGTNSGSFLQAYAVNRFLSDRGYNPTFYRTATEKQFRHKFYDFKFLIKSVLKYPIFGIKRYLLQRNNYKKFSRAYKNQLVISNKSPNHYDKVVLGSDEIWNVKNGFLDLTYYGYGIKNAITFSVSAGNSDYGDITTHPEIVKAIKNIAFITVRDENTAEMVEKIIGKKPFLTLDPTFLIDKNLYETELNPKLLGKRYLLVYAYSLAKNEKRFVKRYAKENHLKIVALGFFWLGADYNFSIAPLELYTIAKNADKIYTNTFHGTVFSILAEKTFISAPVYAKNKIATMMNIFGLTDRIACDVTDYYTLASLMNKPIDYCEVNKKVENAVKESKKIIESGLHE